MPKKLFKSSANPSTTTLILQPSTFSDGLPLPKLFVFDLDYTLWPFWVDTHVTPPLKANPDHSSAKDRYGESFGFYNDVPSILVALRAKSIPVAAASRTSAPELAREMLKLLRLEGKNKAGEYFNYMEIYPGDKKTHFRKLKEASALEYEDMLFFDDESRNRNVETLGVTMYLVRDGVTRPEIDKGVKEWRKRRGISAAAGDGAGNEKVGGDADDE